MKAKKSQSQLTVSKQEQRQLIQVAIAADKLREKIGFQGRNVCYLPRNHEYREYTINDLADLEENLHNIALIQYDDTDLKNFIQYMVKTIDQFYDEVFNSCLCDVIPTRFITFIEYWDHKLEQIGE